MESLLWKASLDLIGIKALGVDLNHVESNDSHLHTLVGETMKQSLSGHIIHYLSSYLPLRRLLPLEMNNNFLSSCAQIRELIWAHVRDCRCQINSGTKTGTPNAIRLMMEQEPLWNDEEIVEYVSKPQRTQPRLKTDTLPSLLDFKSLDTRPRHYIM